MTFDSKNIKIKQSDPKHSKSTKQNSKGVRSNVPPRQSSLKTLMDKSLLTCYLSLLIDKVAHFITDQMFTLRAHPTSLEGLMNYALHQRDMDRLIEQIP